jgi:hypothetical protein
MDLINTPSLPEEIKNHIIAKQNLSNEFGQIVKFVFKNIIKDEEKVKYQLGKIAKFRVLKIKDKQIFERIADRYRWPKELHKGKPSIELRDLKTGKIKEAYFDEDNYADSFNNLISYEAGNELIIRDCHSLFKYTTLAKNLFTQLINRPVYFDGFLRNGLVDIPSELHSFDRHLIIKNVYGLLKCRLNGKIKILKKEQAAFVNKETEIKIYGIKKPTFYLYYYL